MTYYKSTIDISKKSIYKNMRKNIIKTRKKLIDAIDVIDDNERKESSYTQDILDGKS